MHGVDGRMVEVLVDGCWMVDGVCEARPKIARARLDLMII